jgi:hypothetical protein
VAIKLPRHVYSPKLGVGSTGSGRTPGEESIGACPTAELPTWGTHVGSVPGTRLPPNSLEPGRSPTTMLKGVLSSMNGRTRSERALLREAFALVLGLRSQPHARKLLGQAVTFLRMLEHQGEAGGLPVVVSVQVMRLRKY